MLMQSTRLWGRAGSHDTTYPSTSCFVLRIFHRYKGIKDIGRLKILSEEKKMTVTIRGKKEKWKSQFAELSPTPHHTTHKHTYPTNADGSRARRDVSFRVLRVSTVLYCASVIRCLCGRWDDRNVGTLARKVEFAGDVTGGRRFTHVRAPYMSVSKG